jgi:O-antigen/teichoic acid export membrane protein
MQYLKYLSIAKKPILAFVNSHLIRSITVYTFFRVINRTIPVILLPFLTHFLTPEDYAIVDFYMFFLLLLTPIIGLNTSGSIARFFYDRDELNYPVYISTIIYFNFFTTAILLLLLNLFGYFLLQVIHWQFGLAFFVYLGFNACFNQVTIIQLTNWRVRNMPVPYGILGSIRTFVEIGLSIFLVMFFLTDWQGRILGQFSGSLISLVIALYFLINNGLLTFRFNYSYIRKAISYGAPLIFHSIGGVLIGYSNRFFIYKFIDISSAGIFAAAFQIGLAISLLHSSFNEAWVPYFFNLLKNSNSKKTKVKIVQITYVYFLCLILMTVLIILSLPMIYMTIDAKYSSGVSISIWIMIGFLFNGMYKMFCNYLLFLKKTKLVALGTVLTFFFNLLLNYLLIPDFGLIGAAISLTITFFIQFLIFSIISIYLYRMPWLSFLRFK